VLAECPAEAQPAPRTVSEACGVLHRNAHPEQVPERGRDHVVRRLLRRRKHDQPGGPAPGGQVPEQFGELSPDLTVGEQVMRELVEAARDTLVIGT